jgi:8-oxo-dGTP diphosphatase
MLLVAAAALIDADGRVLICQRPEGKQLAGLWEFPGGKVEEGELPEAALVREVEEELGLRLEAEALEPACFASAPLGENHMILLLYLCRQWEGEPRALDAAALKWLRVEEMVAAEMPPADQPLIGLLSALL